MKPYNLETYKPININNNLHWINFCPNLKRLHQNKIKMRQSLILWFASFCHQMEISNVYEIKIRLMELRSYLKEYTEIINEFFDVKQLGYFINSENTDVTTLRLKENVCNKFSLDGILIKFIPPTIQLNESQIVSKVKIIGKDTNIAHDIARKYYRFDIIPQINWIVQQNEIEFVFERAGELKLRDTSVWPINAIENWPSRLRTYLFGNSIDLTSAYTQYLYCLLKKFKSEEYIKTFYNHLFDILFNKDDYRKYLCENVFKLEYNEDGIKFVKNVIMSLANGSKISANILTASFNKSSCASLIKDNYMIDENNYEQIGNYLQCISNQFKNAKKECLIYINGKYPNKTDMKKLFLNYFDWERSCRYKIWNYIGNYGIMMHDGIDGVPDEAIEKLQDMINELQIMVT